MPKLFAANYRGGNSSLEILSFPKPEYTLKSKEDKSVYWKA